MFTGIVSELGTVAATTETSTGRRIVIDEMMGRGVTAERSAVQALVRPSTPKVTLSRALPSYRTGTWKYCCPVVVVPTKYGAPLTVKPEPLTVNSPSPAVVTSARILSTTSDEVPGVMSPMM